MARVTVEDCITVIPNRFKLVVLAAQRARALSSGSELTVEKENDKNPVVALREIAEQSTPFSPLEEALIKGLQRYVQMDEMIDDNVGFGTIVPSTDDEISSSSENELSPFAVGNVVSELEEDQEVILDSELLDEDEDENEDKQSNAVEDTSDGLGHHDDQDGSENKATSEDEDNPL